MARKSKTIMTVVIIIAAALAIARFSSDEDTWLCRNGKWVKHGNPKAGPPAAGCGQNTTKGTAMKITSTAFTDNAPIPTIYSCKGENINPPLEFSEIPPAAKSLALILHDPDAPVPGGFTHWVIYDMPPITTAIAEHSTPPGTQGANGAGKSEYTGPCPPSGTHRYFFYLYALDTTLNFIKTPTKTDLEAAMQGHILTQTQLLGTFAH